MLCIRILTILRGVISYIRSECAKIARNNKHLIHTYTYTLRNPLAPFVVAAAPVTYELNVASIDIKTMKSLHCTTDLVISEHRPAIMFKIVGSLHYSSH